MPRDFSEPERTDKNETNNNDNNSNGRFGTIVIENLIDNGQFNRKSPPPKPTEKKNNSEE